MSPSVNKAIDASMEVGVITSTNVMPGMEYTDAAVDSRKRHPDVSIGIHWTLSAGKPVSEDDKVESLVDDDGFFWSCNEFRKRYRKGLIKEQEIKHELLEQYNKFCILCGKPDYWNTHQNIHVDFKIFNLFLSVAVECKIDKMRTRQRIYVTAKFKNTFTVKTKLLEPFKTIILNYWMDKAKKLSIKAPVGLLVYMNEDDKLDIEFVLKNIQMEG